MLPEYEVLVRRGDWLVYIEISNWYSYWLSIPVGYWNSTWFTGTGTGDVVYWCVWVWIVGPDWECFWLNCVPVSTLVRVTPLNLHG